MKKIIALFLVLGISMTMLAGCGGDSSEKSGSDSTDSAEEESQYQIEWPDSGLATLLPSPKSNMLRNIYDSSSSFYVEVEETSLEDFNEYVKACQDRGFTVDYYKTDYDYSAENEDGAQLSILYYLSQEVMEINLFAPREDSDSGEAETAGAESEPEPDTQESQTDASGGAEEKEGTIETQPVEQEPEPAVSDSTGDSADGVSPSVKDALDSYESFMDEYVAFMQKYKNSTDVTSMLSDYADYMEKYSEAIQKLNDMDTENFSAADWEYYIEVTSRVADKLADAT